MITRPYILKKNISSSVNSFFRFTSAFTQVRGTAVYRLRNSTTMTELQPPVQASSSNNNDETVNKRARSSSPPSKQPSKFSRKNHKKKGKRKVDILSVEGCLIHDIIDFKTSLGQPLSVNKSDDGSSFVLDLISATEYREVEVEIAKLSSIGDGIGLYKESNGEEHVVVVPFTVPGDRVKAKLYSQLPFFSYADLLEVLKAGDARDDSLIRCKYFAKCAGCQFQMLPYADQLSHKREVIARAYKHFATLAPGILPEIGETIASPLEYEYRTKLTPHFDVPRRKPVPEDVPIGFNIKGRQTVLDIEECPIGTAVLNETLTKERKTIKETFGTYKRGATLLLRESTRVDTETHEQFKTAVTNAKQTVTEYVNGLKFEYPANEFFQCNNSVLPRVTQYVNDQLQLPATPEGKGPRFLVDAYCGSGLFSITCNKSVEKVIGVEIAAKSVEYASTNAKNNNLTNTEFVLGDASVIFKKITTPADDTSIILDPPRKGCGDNFMSQLLDFRPRRIVYVSCNVHTQAKDISYFINDPRGSKYIINSVRGFDFFPQTHHVESVAVLTRQD
ncbi:S-adenosyl-L-methionine-dependent methyltransferase [Lipomyces japonicus]|uniref:S-adenosyl-L-methionine-dependent methyltransferase n=1 Tax=Lipomyces japonicus TaxID=56871 RepID=UPI0034CE75F4